MAMKNGAQDEKLIRDLYEKLDWFTFQATEEEFDPEQVQAILNLLDRLSPLPEQGAEGAETVKDASAKASDAQEAFERFKQKYHITDEDLARKNAGAAEDGTDNGRKILPFSAESSEELALDGAQMRDLLEEKNAQANADVRTGCAADKTRRKRFWTSGRGKIAAAAAAVIVVCAGYSIGTSAVQQKPFLEVVRDGIHGFKVTVTGNEMESEERGSIDSSDYDKIYYGSWEEVAEVNPDILIPEYIPEGLELDELYMQDCGEYIRYVGDYRGNKENDTLRIDVRYYAGGYAKSDLENEEMGILIDEDNNISYFQIENYYIAVWKENRIIYIVKGNSLENIKKIITQLD